MADKEPTATVLEMKPEDYAKSRARLITFFAHMAVSAGDKHGWPEDVIEALAIVSLSCFELGCHMGMHNPDIADTWSVILGGTHDSERWRETHGYSHEVTRMLQGEVVAEEVSIPRAVELVNKLNQSGEDNGKPN